MTQALTMNLPISGSHDLFAQAQAAPMLSASEEYDLACRLRDHDDLDAARQLVLSHLRFVIKVARGYQGYGLAQNDLVQEGSIGLMKAVRRFDPDLGVRLVSFAVHWIRAEIHEYIIRNWRIVKIATTKAQRKLFFNLRSSKKRLGWMNREEVNDVAETLGVKPEEVLAMEARLSAYDESFDAPGDDSDEAAFSPSRALATSLPTPEESVADAQEVAIRSHALLTALADLDPRSRTIVEQRWLGDETKATLQDLADEFGVSAERVRQLEKAALTKLRKVMSDSLALPAPT